jgi:hydrogenase-4 component E
VTMSHLDQVLLLTVVLTNFVVLGTTRLSTCIRAIAVQGLLLGVLPLVLHPGAEPGLVALAVGTVLVKAVFLPSFLLWAIREASVRREVEPLIGYITSLLLGAVAVAIAFAVAQRLPLPEQSLALLVPVGLSTVIIGLLVLTTRVKAVTQVVGYVMLENGIYAFGLTLAKRVPLLVELGVLLDVFVGVFVMGIVVFHINREFDSLSSAHLTELKD